MATGLKLKFALRYGESAYVWQITNLSSRSGRTRAEPLLCSEGAALDTRGSGSHQEELLPPQLAAAASRPVRERRGHSAAYWHPAALPQAGRRWVSPMANVFDDLIRPTLVSVPALEVIHSEWRDGVKFLSQPPWSGPT